MRALFFLSPTFDLDPVNIENWIGPFASELQKLGCNVTRFFPNETKLQPYDVIHVFSCEDPETWVHLRRYATKIIVTPGLQPNEFQPSVIRSWILTAFRSIRAVHSFFRPRGDETSFFQYGSFFLVTHPSWALHIRRMWKIRRERILPISPQAEKAAHQAYAVYQNALQS